VVHKVPDQPANEAILRLIGNRSLDDLLLHCSDAGPGDHVSRVLLPISASHEASIVRAQRSCEHACAPRPMHLAKLDRPSAAIKSVRMEEDLVDLLKVAAANHGLFLARVGDLWHWWNWPFIWLLARSLHAR